MKTLLKQKILLSICSFLLAIAPVLSSSMQSAFFWGETDIPKSLRN